MDHPHIVRIEHQGTLLGLIIRARFSEDGVHFFTPTAFSQQLGFMKHPAGRVIEAHSHRPRLREITYTQEVLVIRKGRLRVDFYSTEEAYLESWELAANDVLLLVAGGHGFEVLEPLEMLEIKQGPYMEVDDKVRFEGVSPGAVKLKREPR